MWHLKEIIHGKHLGQCLAQNKNLIGHSMLALMVILFVPNSLLDMKCDGSRGQESGWPGAVTRSTPKVGPAYTLSLSWPSGGRSPCHLVADPKRGTWLGIEIDTFWSMDLWLLSIFLTLLWARSAASGSFKGWWRTTSKTRAQFPATFWLATPNKKFQKSTSSWLDRLGSNPDCHSLAMWRHFTSMNGKISFSFFCNFFFFIFQL